MCSQKYDLANVFITEMKRSGPLSRGKIFIIVSAAIVLAATAGLTLFSIEKTVSVKYQHAVNLLESDDYIKAKEEFLCFSGYRDSAVKAKECQDSMDYNYAEALLKSGEYAAAKEAFAALGDFGSAPKKVFECDYQAAAALMDSGKLEEAEGAFLALGGFSDSEEQAGKCRNELDYTAAAELLNQKDYEHAYSLFKPLGDYKDSAEKLKECRNNLDYIAADLAYKEKDFYTAYQGFTQLGSFSDSTKRAARCIQKKPKTGQIYRDHSIHGYESPFGKSYDSRLTLKAPSSGYYVFVKIYWGNRHISSVFIAPGKRATVKLPWLLGEFNQIYSINAAAGKLWFGQRAAFGDNAYYGVVSRDYRMKHNGSYTITLRVNKGKMKYTEISRTGF